MVCINHFYTDTEEEIRLIRDAAESLGARVAVSRHWEKGGEGSRELAETVIDACNSKADFKFLYEANIPFKKRIFKIATEVYGADNVHYSPQASEKLEKLDNGNSEEINKLGVCMVKTHLSLSHDPAVKGRPKGWTLPIRDILLYQGAGFVVPVAGDIKLMPGTASDPAFRNIDVDVHTGKVKGLF